MAVVTYRFGHYKIIVKCHKVLCLSSIFVNPIISETLSFRSTASNFFPLTPFPIPEYCIKRLAHRGNHIPRFITPARKVFPLFPQSSQEEPTLPAWCRRAVVQLPMERRQTEEPLPVLHRPFESRLTFPLHAHLSE